jgi:hypothetical protein
VGRASTRSLTGVTDASAVSFRVRQINRAGLLSLVTLAVVALTACPGPATNNGGGTPVGPGGVGGPEQPPATSDVTIDDLESVTIAGVLLKPSAMSMPGMTRVLSKKKTTLAKQRKQFARAKADKKGAHGRILATMLWDESKATQDEAAKRALREEAKAVLDEVRAAKNDDVSAITLQMSFALERWLGNDAAAADVGALVLEKFPDSKSADALAPWVGFLRLVLARNAEAATLVESWPPASLAAKPLRAYVAAWVAFRKGDAAAARGLIMDAVSGWKSNATLPTLQAETVLLLARTGTNFDEAAAVIRAMANGQAALEYMLAFRLYEGYEAAGYAADAYDALETALALDAPPADRVVLLVRQANLLVVDGRVRMVAPKMGQALEAVTACGEACAGKDTEIVGQVGKLASHLHTIYSTTQDEEYYAGAKALYDLYMGSGAADVSTYQGYYQGLEDTKTNMTANTGTHDKKTIGAALTLRNNVAKACYEHHLQSDPAMAGSIALELVIGADGKVAEVGGGFPNEPAGMKDVVDCLTDRAQTWTFPSRTAAGKTTATATYDLAPAAP